MYVIYVKYIIGLYLYIYNRGEFVKALMFNSREMVD